MKFHLVKKDLNKNQFNRLLSIIRSQNRSSILSNLSSNNIKNYINIVIKNKNMELFIASNPKIIGYAIIANKTSIDATAGAERCGGRVLIGVL